MDISTDPASPVRRVLDADVLRHIHGAVRDAADTVQLLGCTLSVLYDALPTAGAESTTSPIVPGSYAIPRIQWQAILTAMTRRAEAWGTAAEIGLDLAMNLLPDSYDDPSVPTPDLALPDHRPTEVRITLNRDAIDVITSCEAHLDHLHAHYGRASEVYQAALHRWHRGLTAVLTMNTGSDTRISRDAPLSLFVQASSGLVYGLVFRASTRHCVSDGCGVLIADDATTATTSAGASPPDHAHVPSYPLGAPQPGLWSLHS